jgi:hypothetical protein
MMIMLSLVILSSAGGVLVVIVAVVCSACTREERTVMICFIEFIRSYFCPLFSEQPAVAVLHVVLTSTDLLLPV